MKFLVCISKTPDTTSKINFTNNNTEFDKTNVQYIVNPYDEWYALVRAIELKEQFGGSVTTITVGTAEDDAIIRKALAIGADDAVRVDAEAKDAFQVSTQIANYAKENGFDVVLVGKETIDYNGGVVGSMVAEIMDAAYVAIATNLDMDGNTATITRDIGGGSEVVEVQTPFVLSAAKGVAEQRIPNMRGIMAARTKPLTVVPANDAEERLSISSYELPPEKSAVKMVDAENVQELVDLLHNEAKMI